MKFSEEKKLLLIVLGVLFGLITLFYLQRASRYVIQNIPLFKPTVVADPIWRSVQKRANNAVVQVFVDVAYFNWVEPYKSPDQSRTRGSGFFIDDQGHIVSNFHVIDEATTMKIQIPALGKEQFDVIVVGACPKADLSLLKLTDESLQKVIERIGSINYLEFGDSDGVVRTQEILALGYPLGQEKLKSVKGIVSGRERVWGESYLQTTVPINEGNSGGPSLDANGKVIGINTASITGADNICYIIPSNDVKQVVADLYTKKFLRKSRLGCELTIATKETVAFLKNPEPGGVYISRVYKGSLMDLAGVREGDMIYHVNGYTVDRYGEVVVPWSEDKVHLRDVVNRFAIGEKVRFVLYRNGNPVEVDVTFQFVNLLPMRVIYPEYEPVDYEIIGGMVVMELQLNHIPYFKSRNPYLVKYVKKINQYKPVLIVTHIFPSSQAKLSRSLFVGNVIKEVNGERVRTLKAFREAIMYEKNSPYLRIKSEKQRLTVLSLKKVLQDEDRLVATYLYKKSALCQELSTTSNISQAVL